jgi:hypothetical protein
MTHERPVAGHFFAGFTITNLSTDRIEQIRCDAKVGHELLHAQVQRFYSSFIHGPAEVVCSWLIPGGAGGKRLHLAEQDGRPWVFLAQGKLGGGLASGPAYTWHVR